MHKTLLVYLAIVFGANVCLGQPDSSEDGPIWIDSTRAETPAVAPDSADSTLRQMVRKLANPPAPALHQKRRAKSPAAPPDNLSPFSCNAMNAVGITLQYFSYAEHPSLSDIFPPGFPLALVSGTPKSTEYGLLFGFNYDGSMRKPGSPVLFRPNLEVHFGIHQTYDGTTQAAPVTDRKGDTIGYQFNPVHIYKNNYFVQAGLDAGYCRTRVALPFYLYSGIKGRFWYRDQVADTTSYANQITNSEMYYWFSAPIGVALSLPLSPRLALGVDLSCDLMFFGQMQALFSAWEPDSTWRTDFPAVTLGNLPGFRAEMSLVYKTTGGITLRFAPFFSYYSFGKSESETAKQYTNGVYTGEANDQTFDEPSSDSWLVGAKFQIVFMSGKSRAP